jgi:hypothetical protein
MNCHFSTKTHITLHVYACSNVTKIMIESKHGHEQIANDAILTSGCRKE